MTVLLMILFVNVLYVLWVIRRVQPQRRYDELVKAARDMDPQLRQKGWVITGLRLRSRGWHGWGAIGEIYWRTPEGNRATGKVIW
jgi:hypothetical protein